MFGWLRRSSARSAGGADPDALRNEGLGLAMDWGEDWLAPIQERLRERHPRLTRAELDELDATCRAAMKLGHETVHALVRAHGKDLALPSFAERFAVQVPWASAENVERLFNQGLYYAWKTGGPAGPAGSERSVR